MKHNKIKIPKKTPCSKCGNVTIVHASARTQEDILSRIELLEGLTGKAKPMDHGNADAHTGLEARQALGSCLVVVMRVFLVLVALGSLFTALIDVQPAYYKHIAESKFDKRGAIDANFFANFLSLVTFMLAGILGAISKRKVVVVFTFTAILGVLCCFVVVVMYAHFFGWDFTLTVAPIQSQIMPLLGVGLLSAVIAQHLSNAINGSN